jgi:hypothetical protein
MSLSFPRTLTLKRLTNIKAVLSVVFFLPAFISPFIPHALSRFVLAIDVVFSYLYVNRPTAFGIISTDSDISLAG